jgi:hypothetical protein
MGLHGLLQGQLYFTLYKVLQNLMPLGVERRGMETSSCDVTPCNLVNNHLPYPEGIDFSVFNREEKANSV